MGLFAFIIGALPGIIIIILGTKLYNIKKYAESTLYLDDGDMRIQIEGILDNLISYLKIEALMFVIGILFEVVTIFIKLII